MTRWILSVGLMCLLAGSAHAVTRNATSDHVCGQIHWQVNIRPPNIYLSAINRTRARIRVQYRVRNSRSTFNARRDISRRRTGNVRWGSIRAGQKYTVEMRVSRWFHDSECIDGGAPRFVQTITAR